MYITRATLAHPLRLQKRAGEKERERLTSLVLAAFQLFQQAAESGFVDALYNLGRCYHHGEVRDPLLQYVTHRDHDGSLSSMAQGVAKSMEEAVELYTKAAALVRRTLFF